MSQPQAGAGLAEGIHKRNRETTILVGSMWAALCDARERPREPCIPR
jgi:hypothetical protein